MPRASRRRPQRLVVRLHEATGASRTSWDDAVRMAIAAGRKEVAGVIGVEVVKLTGAVAGGRITDYRALVRLAYKERVVGP